jgi:uncharacterized protein (DUF983 family)
MNPLLQNAKYILKCKCPKCHRGGIYCGYLKLVDKCSVCDEDIGNIRADDGPAWLTILLTGHIFVPLFIVVQNAYILPLWVYAVMSPVMIAVSALLILPFSKSFFTYMLWYDRKNRQKDAQEQILK